MLAVQEYLKNKSIDDLANEYNIDIKRYPDSVVLNYRRFLLPGMSNDCALVRECRGLQLGLNTWDVYPRAFNRFFNYGELAGQDFDFSSAEVYDKIDGSLCILYWHPTSQQWELRTRGTAFAENVAHDDKTSFRDLALRALALEELQSISLNRGYSWVFELVSPLNRVITYYPEPRLYLLAAFNNKTGEELEYGTALSDCLANNIRFAEVKRYAFSGINALLDMARKLPKDQEGYVLRDSANRRLKVKNPAYVFMAKAYGNVHLDPTRLLDIAASGEMEEFIAYFPEYRIEIENIINRERLFLDTVKSAYETLSHIDSRKDFAANALSFPFNGLLFMLRDGKSLDEIWSRMSVSKKIEIIEHSLGKMDTAHQ